MKALVTLDEHLRRGSDGRCYACGPIGHSSWREFLEAFDELVLVARVRNDDNPCSGEVQIDGPLVSVWGLPDCTGPWEVALMLRTLRRQVSAAAAECEAYVLRIPGLIAYLAWREVARRGRPYALEVLGDPWEALGPGTVRSPLRPVYRRVAAHAMKAMCGRPDAALYWSKPLQERYPCRKDCYTTVSPRINLSCGYADAQLMSARRARLDQWRVAAATQQRKLRIGFVGSLAQLYKGPDILLRALALCSRGGLVLETFLVGDGRYRKDMHALARKLLVENQVVFLGQLMFGNPDFDLLDSIDLFVMPSRTEGLPRALVEAMSRGCPCIGANVAGIAELLTPDDLFRCGDPEDLAAKILEVTRSPERLTQMSMRNLEKAKEYNPKALRKTRQDFYRFVRMRAELTYKNCPVATAKAAP
jgi:glycosyltransferase involved in cell wall biosynthesis